MNYFFQNLSYPVIFTAVILLSAPMSAYSECKTTSILGGDQQYLGCKIVIDSTQETFRKDLNDELCKFYCRRIGNDAFKSLIEKLDVQRKELKKIDEPSLSECSPSTPLLSPMQALARKLGGRAQGAFIYITYNGKNVPLKITPFFNDEYKVIIPGTPIDDHDRFTDNCLEFELRLQEKSGHVAFIQAAHLDCPIPKVKRGNFILGLVDHMSKKLSLKEVTLEDASSIECSKNGEEADLQFLRTLQKGKGWYEESGYKPEFQDYREYRSKVYDLRNYSLKKLSTLLSQINSETIETLKKDNIRIKQSKFKNKYFDGMSESAQRKYNAITRKVTQYFNDFTDNASLFQAKFAEFKRTNESDKFANFFSWLWTSDCAAYTQLEDFIFTEDVDNSFAYEIKQYRNLTSLLKKKF